MGKRHSRPSIQGKYVMGIVQKLYTILFVTPRFVSLNPNKLLLFNSFRTSLIHSNLYFLVIQLGFRVNPPKVKTYIPNACCAMFWVTWCDILRSHRLLSCMNFQRRMMGFFLYRRLCYHQRHQLTNAAFGRDFETKADRHIV